MAWRAKEPGTAPGSNPEVTMSRPCGVYRVMMLFAAWLSTGCGDPAGPGASNPVAVVSVSPATATVVPQQGLQFTATPSDGTGKALSGRSITWTSSASAVATVSPAGLLTALAPGSAVITATVEGVSGSAAITVADGGFVGPGGGTVRSSNNAISLTVPAGAVPAGVAFTMTPATTPPTPPAGATAVRGTTWVLGPAGTTFGAPVTVVIRYDAGALPRWVVPGDVVLMRWDGTRWSNLTDVVVDPVARTVTGRTPGFSTVGVYFLNPQVTLTPSPARVNGNQRSVVLTAQVSGEGRLPDALQFEWTTTGSNGQFTDQRGNTVQYTALSAVLPAGDLDGIQVIVRGQFDAGGPFEDLGRASTTVRSDLDLIIRMQPASSVVQYASSASITASVIDRNGNLSYDDSGLLRFEWNATSNAGRINLGTQATTVGVATYTAYPASQQSNVRPKGDKITTKFYVMQYTTTELLGGGFQTDSTLVELGVDSAYVQVIPQYQVALSPSGSQLQAGQAVTLQAQLQPAWQEQEQLFFRWNTTGSQGTLSVVQGVSLPQGTVTYTAAANPTGGTDFVDVDVFAGTVGKVGTARASVSVAARTTTVAGALFITTPVALDPGRQCVEAYIVFPLVSGARAYDMHAFGFNDTATGTTEIRRTFTEPLATARACSTAGTGLTGKTGNQFQYLLSSFSGPTSSIANAIANFNTRWAGMQVVVNVRF